MSLPRTAAAARSPAALLAALSLLPVMVSWWLLMNDQFTAAVAEVTPPPPVTPGAMAWIALVSRAAGWVAEALVFALVWAAVGVTLPWGRYLLALGPLSALDLCADALRLHAPAFGEAARVPLAAIGGLAALGPFDGEWRLLGAAFATTGVLTLARIAGAAAVQARLARVPWAAAFALTFGLWLAHHVAIWWALELTAGRSLPGEPAP